MLALALTPIEDVLGTISLDHELGLKILNRKASLYLGGSARAHARRDVNNNDDECYREDSKEDDEVLHSFSHFWLLNLLSDDNDALAVRGLLWVASVLSVWHSHNVSTLVNVRSASTCARLAVVDLSVA